MISSSSILENHIREIISKLKEEAIKLNKQGVQYETLALSNCVTLLQISLDIFQEETDEAEKYQKFEHIFQSVLKILREVKEETC